MLGTRVGYAGGKSLSPTYTHLGDHAEAIEIRYDPATLSYGQLLELYWTLVDPTARSWSGQYRSAVFPLDAGQERLAQATRQAIASRLGREVRTAIEPGARFWPAEDYHQKYYLQQNRELLRALVELTPGGAEAALDTTLAARLNGLAGGHGTAAEVERELDRMGVPAGGRQPMRRLLASLR